MILKGGSGKVFFPDGTEVEVTFELLDVQFSKTPDKTFTYASWMFNDATDRVVGSVRTQSDQIEAVEFGRD